MYRFHPSVQWQKGYPNRQQIIRQVHQLWHRYGLEDKTRFDIKVNKVYQDDRCRWIINDPSQGRFEGLICALGTCGEPKIPHIPGMDQFKGEVYHSSQLTGYVLPPLFLSAPRPLHLPLRLRLACAVSKKDCLTKEMQQICQGQKGCYRWRRRLRR